MIADDVTGAATLARDTLEAAVDQDWEKPAGELEWSCWETVEHMIDDLFAYAAQLAPTRPSTTTHVPFGWQQFREGGPELTVFVDRKEGPAALLHVFEASASMLAAQVATAPPDRVSFHWYGPSDASGFAAMGVIEILVHTYDVAAACGLTWSPPADLCAGALRRLFPDAPAGHGPWPTLLWATGRTELPGHPRRTSWTWDGTPAA